MKNTRKIFALLLTLIMLAALSTAAFADNETLSGGVADSEHNTATTAENSILILKELVIHNTDGKEIYLPEVNYSYTITEAGSADGVGTTIKDGQDPQISGEVYADTAPKALLTESATVSFSHSTATGYTAAGAEAAITQPMAAAADGTSVYGGFTVSFNPANFDHAGVFRYKITESSDDRTTAGVTTAADTANVRYLDVYVRSVDTDNDHVSDSFAIYGYVCFTDATTPIDGADNDTVTAAKKTNGFVHSGDTLTSVADQYYTKNLEVKKSFGTAVLNQTGHQFPFTITLDAGSANGIGNWVNAADTTGAKTSGFTDTHVVLADDLELKAKLSKDQVVELYGIPTEAGVSVKVKEQNDTYDVYALTATVENSSVTDISAVNGVLGAQAYSSDMSTAVPVDGDAKTAILFTNDLTEISPTGVVLRFAPYALMLAAGVFLLVFSRRRRAKAED